MRLHLNSITTGLYKNRLRYGKLPYHLKLIAIDPKGSFSDDFSFQVIYTVLPHRSQLIGKGEAHEENVEALAPFLASMRTNLKRINSLL